MVAPEQRGSGDRDTPKHQADGPRAPHVYYARAARDEEEVAALEEAAQIEGLGHEIAMLRVQLLAALREEKVDLPRVLKGCEVLTKAVATQYRVSPKAKKDLSDNLAAVLNTFGDLILPSDR